MNPSFQGPETKPLAISYTEVHEKPDNNTVDESVEQEDVPLLLMPAPPALDEDEALMGALGLLK